MMRIVGSVPAEAFQRLQTRTERTTAWRVAWPLGSAAVLLPFSRPPVLVPNAWLWEPHDQSIRKERAVAHRRRASPLRFSHPQ